MREARLVERGLVASPGQLHLRVSSMRGEAGQDFFEEVVPFDHVRVALADERRQLFQFRPVQRLRPAGGIREMDDLLSTEICMRRKSVHSMPLKSVLPVASRYCCDGIAQAEVGDAGGFQRGFALGEAPPNFQTREGVESQIARQRGPLPAYPPPFLRRP